MPVCAHTGALAFVQALERILDLAGSVECGNVRAPIPLSAGRYRQIVHAALAQHGKGHFVTQKFMQQAMNSRRRRKPTLEWQAISFTVSLYLFICLALLASHYAAPLLEDVPTAPWDCAGSSSISPFNPC